MHRLGKYNQTDSMSRLVTGNYRALPVMSRFGISLGFGDQTIGEVCRQNGVDTETFLTVVNMAVNPDAPGEPEGGISVEALLQYLHNSHDYFLGFRLPGIRTQLVDIVGESDSLARAIVNYFDEYAAEVRKHMTYEEDTVFPYVRSLLKGERPTGYDIGIFSRQHDQVEARLSEFKNILIKYYPAKSTNTMNNLLFDIFNCENDLASHNETEDRLFVPAIAALEQNTAEK